MVGVTNLWDILSVDFPHACLMTSFIKKYDSALLKKEIKHVLRRKKNQVSRLICHGSKKGISEFADINAYTHLLDKILNEPL